MNRTLWNAARPSNLPRGNVTHADGVHRQAAIRCAAARDLDTGSAVRLRLGPSTTRSSDTAPAGMRETHAARRSRTSAARMLSAILLPAMAGLGVLLPGGSAEAQAAPSVASIVFLTSPALDDTYRHGEAIRVRVEFDRDVRTIGPAALPLTIGTRTRLAWNDAELEKFIAFSYTVREDDLDTDGISIAADAREGTIPEDDPLTRSLSSRARAEGHAEAVLAVLRTRGIDTAGLAEDAGLLTRCSLDASMAAALGCTGEADFRRRLREASQAGSDANVGRSSGSSTLTPGS